jgi:hypothetical protein
MAAASGNVPSLTAAEKKAQKAAELQARMLKHEQEAAAMKKKLADQLEKAAAEAELEARKAALKAQKESTMASLGISATPKSKKKMSPASRLAMMMAENQGVAAAVNEGAVAREAAKAAFKMLPLHEKIQHLRAKAEADIALAELKLAEHKEKVHARLLREIAAVEREAQGGLGAMAAHASSASSGMLDVLAASASASAASSSMAASGKRRTSQQVYNELARELAYEEGRLERRTRGEKLSPTKKRKPSLERIADIRKKMNESMSRIRGQEERSATRKAVQANKAAALLRNQAALAEYEAQRKKKTNGK